MRCLVSTKLIFCILVIAFLLLNIVQESGAFYIPRRRLKREGETVLPKEDYNLPPPTGPSNPFPSGNSPFPGRSASNLSPDWPFSHQFSNGLDVNPGRITELTGNLNIPIKEWGAVWDMKGRLNAGPAHTWYNYGHLLQPVNPYNLPPSTIAQLSQSPEFLASRANTSIVPVAQLPGGWRPVNCKPPLCNPFVHTFDTAVQVMPSSGAFVDGGLDFPVPTGPMGEGVRFPLSGNLFAGKQPINFNYGQHLTPVDPFKNYKPDKKQSIGSNVRQIQELQELQLPDSSSSSDRETANLIRMQQKETLRQGSQRKQPQFQPFPSQPTAAASNSGNNLPAGSLPLVKPPRIPTG